jgi:hypothetical protein
LAETSSIITGASYVIGPPGAAQQAVAIGTTGILGFPQEGTEYAIMSSGAALDWPGPNVHTGYSTAYGQVHPTFTDIFDVTTLRVDLLVPDEHNCLALDFVFLSEEYPEYIGKMVNDSFIAELDVNDWVTTAAAVNAPHNFAFDNLGNPISIDAAGPASMNAANAGTTMFDGATPLLTAYTVVTPGVHSIYLTIFDRGDAIFDSTVFLDALRSGHVDDVQAECVPGAKPWEGWPPTPTPTPTPTQFIEPTPTPTPTPTPSPSPTPTPTPTPSPTPSPSPPPSGTLALTGPDSGFTGTLPALGAFGVGLALVLTAVAYRRRQAIDA